MLEATFGQTAGSIRASLASLPAVGSRYLVRRPLPTLLHATAPPPTPQAPILPSRVSHRGVFLRLLPVGQSLRLCWVQTMSTTPSPSPNKHSMGSTPRLPPHSCNSPMGSRHPLRLTWLTLTSVQPQVPH